MRGVVPRRRSGRAHRQLLGAVCAALTLTFSSIGCSGSSDQSAGGRTPATDPTTTATSSPRASLSPSANPTVSTASCVRRPRSAAKVPEPKRLQVGESNPVEDPYYPQTSNPEIDVLHYFLDLGYRNGVLCGTATVTLRTMQPTETIRLDLADALEVRTVTLDGYAVPFTHESNGLTMTTRKLKRGRPHSLVIEYVGRPAPVRAPSKRADMSQGLGWNTAPDGTVYTFQEPYGAFTWYPANDHPSDKALYDARITTSSPDIGVFNGTLEDKRVGGGATTTRWHVEEPMATYLTTIAIGPYQKYSGSTASGLAITYWLMDRDKRLLPRLHAAARAGFDWLVVHAGPYPFSSLGFVVVGGESAMETQTMVTLGRGQASFAGPNIQHEIAHQWYGDSVTPRTWQGMWINEGWAEYLQQAFEAGTNPARLDRQMDKFRQYDAAGRRVAGPPGDYDPTRFGDTNVYVGPAVLLHEIRHRIGERRFEQVVKAWPAEHENQNVDRAEFTNWIENFTHRNLASLIDRWLDSPSTPRPR